MIRNKSTLASNVSAFGEENQQKIADLRVSLFGQNELSDYVTMLLIGLGVGEIGIQGKRTDRGLKPFTTQFDTNPHSHISRTNEKALTYKHTQLNPQITCNFEQDDVYFTEVDDMLQTNTTGIYIPVENSTKPSSPLTTILASYIVDQIRKTQFHVCTKDKPNEEIPDFAKKVFGEHTHKAKKRDINHALIIGAGGIGTYLGLELAKANVPEISIFDNDTIEAKNLNRQLVYLTHINEKKAPTLASELQKLSPQSSFHGHDMYVTKKEQLTDYIKDTNVDFVFCATDNFPSRILISQTCEDLKIPLIEGGCNNYNAVVSQYEPGKTDPVHITRKFAKQAQPKNEKKKSTSCLETANPSVVIPNAMAGALMYAMSMQRFSPSGETRFLQDLLMYDSFSPKSIYEVSL